MTDREGPKGIGGWLLLFLVMIGLVTPVLAGLGAWASHSDKLADYLGPGRMRALIAFDWTMVALRVLLGWYVAARLIAVRRWLSVRIAIAYLWLGLPVLLLVQATLAHLLNWADFEQSLVYSFVQANPLLWIGAAIVWTAYLLRSKRVARTYARPGLAAASAADTVEVFE